MITDKCWLYAGNLTNNGYGVVQNEVAHRLMYKLLVGEIPQGLQLDHLCKVKACINPEHLEPVTRQENMQRYFAERYPKCRSQHKLEGDNLAVYYYKGKPKRRCRACANEYQKLQKRRMRAKL